MKNSLFKRIVFTTLLSLGALMIVNSVFAIDAEEIAGKFRKAFKSIKNFSADFEQTTITGGKKRTALGKLTFQKPNLLRQEYLEPKTKKVSQLIVSDGKSLISYTPMIKQVTKQDIDKNQEIFPGFGQSLENVEKNYNIKLIKDELAEKKGVHCIELTPKKTTEDTMIFDAVQIWVRDEDSIPVQVMYRDDKNGATFFFSFNNIKLNDKLDDSVFKFTIPTGVQVVTVPSNK
jgi:chaperone LolA